MSRKYLVWLAPLLCLLNLSAAHALGLELAVGGWRQSPSGEFSYKAIQSGDLLNVEDELGYDSEDRFQGRLKIDMPLFLPNIALVAAPTEFSGTGQKSADFTFGNETFQGSVPFESKLTFNQFDVTLYYGLPFIKTATLNTLNIDVGINVRIVDLNAQIHQAGTGTEQSYDATVPVPQLYLAAQVMPTEWLSIEGEGRGLSIGDNMMYSLIGRLRFDVLGPAFIAGGYRYDSIDVDEDDLEADFIIQGPFVEAGIRF